MSFVRMVALRYLWALKRGSFISVISGFSVVGVALGVASLIVVMGVMSGFTTDLRDKILGANAHILVFSYRGQIEDPQEAMRVISAVPGVKGTAAFIYSEAMLSANGAVKGLALRGVDPENADKVLGIFKLMVKGELRNLLPGWSLEGSGLAVGSSIVGSSVTDGKVAGDAGKAGEDSSGSEVQDNKKSRPIRTLPGIIVGKELAKRMGLGLGSRVSVLSPSGQKSSTGFNPRILPFQVAGVFATGMFEYDNTMAFVSLDSARNILSISGDSVFGIEVVVDDIYRADSISQELNRTLSAPLYSRSWMDMNANLFAALKLEKTAMGVILTFIVLVGSFSIITSLVMLVMEKKRDIAILMSMGATAQDIRKIFLLQGVIIGGVGTAVGNVLGLGIAFLVERYQFIKLPEGVYSTNHLTVLIEWPDIAIISGAAMLICFLATIYPARQAANLRPVEALRQE